MPDRAVVIAHHHPRGVIAEGLGRLVKRALRFAARVVFVSTSLVADDAIELPSDVEVIRRENVGYDFYSYKTGIAALGDVSAYRGLVLLNSSFACLDADRLFGNFLARARPGVDLLGLTASREMAPHLQSYLVSFEGERVLSSEAFRRWWAAMTPVSERERVIAQYEIGMSRHFHQQGFTLDAAFHPTPRQRELALWRWQKFRERNPQVRDRSADELNPTHFLWDVLLDEFGVVKLELLQRNPYGLDLGKLAALRDSDPVARRLLDNAADRSADGMGAGEALRGSGRGSGSGQSGSGDLGV